MSHSLRIELRLDAAAVARQRTLGARRVWALKDPVLPGAQPAEDLGFHGLWAGKAQVCLHAGQAVRREARALLEKDAHFVMPIDVIEGGGDEPELFTGVGGERLEALALQRIEASRLAEEARRQSREAVAHGVGAEIEG